MTKPLTKPVIEQAFVRRLKTKPIVTFLLAFLIFFIPYVILAKIYGVPIFNETGPGRVKVPHLFAWAPTWTAFGMASFLSLILAIEQYAQKQKVQIEAEFPTYFSNDKKVLRILHMISSKARLGLKLATAFGVIFGVLITFFLVVVPAADWRELVLTPRPWFILFGIALVTFSVRLVFLAYFENAKLKEAMSVATLHSLYDKTPQSVFVRIAMRRLLSWMLLIGLSSIFLVRGEDISIIAWPWIIVAIFMSAFSFISALDIGHKLILRHKIEAIEGLNKKIQAVTKTGIEKPSEATKLMALLALENKIQNIPEWTISMPIAFKILSYFFIPLATWVSATIVREIVVSSLH